MNVAEAKRVRISSVIVFLKERMMGTALAFSDREKTKRANGIVAPAVPTRMSRRGCAVRGNNGIPHSRAKTNARIKAAPSTRRARIRSFDRNVIVCFLIALSPMTNGILMSSLYRWRERGGVRVDI
jgi:hypothetical protein